MNNYILIPVSIHQGATTALMYSICKRCRFSEII